MNLTPREKDKLMISLAAIVARGRLKRGVKLNYPESCCAHIRFRLGGGARRQVGCGAHVRKAERC